METEKVIYPKGIHSIFYPIFIFFKKLQFLLSKTNLIIFIKEIH